MSGHEGRLELTWTNKDKALLSTGDGKYDYAFVDPADRRVAEVRLLREVERIDAETPADRPEDLPAPTTDNLLVTGDAMHVLDALAKIPEYAERYLGKVKLVYIDPPFNTGQAFTNYDDNIEHSIWLTMLRDRLRQIKPLLAPDASIWVHLDDVEVHRCRVVMDEEFGQDNFVAQVAWEKGDSPRMDALQFSERHDTLLVYATSRSWRPNRFASATKLDFPHVDERGRRYRAPGPLRKWGSNSDRADRPNLWYPLVAPDGTKVWPHKPDGREGYWRWKQSVALERSADLHWEDKGSGLQPYVKEYEDEARKPVPPESLWRNDVAGHNRRAKAEIKALFGAASTFATPKPELLLARIIQVSTSPGDLVLDCFAGSGTTAAVAHKMGRRWITSELIERTVARFAKPRLRKVVEGKDLGGVTTSKERVAMSDKPLPGRVTPEEAKAFNTTLTRVIDDGDVELTVDMSSQLASLVRAAKKADCGPLDNEETKAFLRLLKKFGGAGQVDVTKQAKSQLAGATKTRDQVTQLWHGGGGFTHLEVGPSMFTEVGGMILLAEWATQGALTEAMCAQLGVRYEPEGVFAGRSGRVRIAVVDGMVGAGTIDAIVDQLLEAENVEIWATQLSDDAKAHLQQVRPRSRLHRIPAAVLDTYRRKKAAHSPFVSKTTEEDGATDG